MSDLYFLDENYNAFIDIVNELYVGETEFIKKFQAEISKARAPYVGKLKKPIKGNKDFIKIGDMIAEEFGFHAVTFSVPYDISSNAFTYPITSTIDQNVKGVKPKFFKDQGLKYDPETNKLCILVAVTAGVWFNPEFTDREVVAAILHEIGHSFVLQSNRTVEMVESLRICTALLVIMQTLSDITNENIDNKLKGVKITNDLLTIFNLTNIGKQIINTVSRELANNPLFKSFNSISMITDWLTKLLFNIKKEISNFNLFKKEVYFNILKNLSISLIFGSLPGFKQLTAFNRSQEYLSDSFATMYGYGPDVSSFLLKIEFSKNPSGTAVQKILNSIPIIGAINQAVTIPILMLQLPVEAHPSTPARIDKILKELKEEYQESDLDPKTKKAIECNIKEMERIKKEISAVPSKSKNKFDGEMVKRMWIAFLTNKGDFMNDHEKYYTDLKARDKYVRESLDILDDINLI